MSYPEKFTGQAAMNKEDGKAWKLQSWEYKPKEWNELDIDVEVSACGICGSCLHTLSSGWGESKYPAVCGHEIVGKVVKAGSKSGHSVGDRVGIGAQSGSCLECEWCKKDLPMYCTGNLGMVSTYQGKWEDGSIAQGGYADYVRARGAFAVKVPEALSDEQAAPMLCAGITTYHPLVRFGAGKGKKVAVVGIGGLGHYGLQWASALGAETFAISHSDSKKNDAEKLGVKPEDFIIASNPEETAKKYAGYFDIILICSFQKDLPLQSLYFPMMRPEGVVILCGLPENQLSFGPSAIVMKGVTLAGSIIGGPKLISEMLDFAVKHNVKSWVETRPMAEASKAVSDMSAGKARYRYVLVN